MFKKLTVLACLISLCPAAAGAQEVAVLLNSQPAQERQAEPARTVNLMPTEERALTLMAASDVQGAQASREQRPGKTHSGLTWKEFCEVHFGEYRWVYWAGAVAAIVAIHVVAAD